MKKTLAVLTLATLGLVACQSNDRVQRDWDVLIPQILGAGQQPVEAAGNLFNVTSPDERRDAIAYLQMKKFGYGEPYMKAYKLLATDPHPLVRGQAMRALGDSGDPSIVPILVKGLNDKVVTVRRDAAVALRTTYSDEAVESLVLHLKGDEDEAVQIDSARALANSRDPRAVRGLIDGLDSRNAAVAFYAHQSLVSITGQNLPAEEGSSWLRWYEATYTAAATQPK